MLNIFKITSNPNETINDVRKQLLFWILIVINILGIPIVIIALVEAFILNQTLIAISYLVFFSPILLITVFRKKIPFKISVAVILTGIWLIGVFNLIIYSFSGAALPIFFTFLVFTTVFINLRSAFFALFLSLLPMAVVGYLYLNNKLSLDISLTELSTQPIAWLTASSVLLFLGGLIVLSFGIIQKKMMTNLDFSKKQEEKLIILNLQLEEDVLKRKQVEKKLKKYQDNLESIINERTKEIGAINEELKSSNEELNVVNQELTEKNKNLEHFNELFVGREFRIKELRDKIEELEGKLQKSK